MPTQQSYGYSGSPLVEGDLLVIESGLESGDRVIVNGTTVLRDDEHTGALPGQTLRRQKDFHA